MITQPRLSTAFAAARHPEPEVKGLKPEGAFLTPIRQSQPGVVGKNPKDAHENSAGWGLTNLGKRCTIILYSDGLKKLRDLF
jgi:hypothetical protein